MEIWKIVAAILHFGNVKFTGTTAFDKDETARIINTDTLNFAAGLIGINAQTFSRVLTQRILSVGKVVVPYKVRHRTSHLKQKAYLDIWHQVYLSKLACSHDGLHWHQCADIHRVCTQFVLSVGKVIVPHEECAVLSPAYILQVRVAEIVHSAHWHWPLASI